MLSHQIDHVIFDWNGTLIDDIELAVRSVNHVNAACGVDDIDCDVYRAKFCFPIKSFYHRLGCNFETLSFEDTIARYLSLFDAGIRECALQPGARQIITWTRNAGLSASILSASHEDTLRDTLHHHRLDGAFDHVMGLQNTLAQGKLAVAGALDTKLGHPGARALIIGDTVHDVEVAIAFGWQVVIVTRGHQEAAHFEDLVVPLMEDLHTLMLALDDDLKQTQLCESRT